MNSTDVEKPFFSVILPTRNRPLLLERALLSVLNQSFTQVEILVIVDGSTQEHLSAYASLEEKYPAVSFEYLVHQPNGHGQSYSMNHGAQLSHGLYLCFLDDDDSWTDGNYLQRAHDSIIASVSPVDVHYSNQRAFYANGNPRTESVWLEDLISQVGSATPHINETYLVDAAFIMRSNGFGHLNCSIFSRDLYAAIEGMDETIRYENDRDVFIRAVDSAETILFSTHYISRHNIPDGAKKENMSTVASAIDKKLFQFRVYDKGICMAKNTDVIRHCRRGKNYELKHMTQILVEQNNFQSAAHYAREALWNSFNIKWLVYTLYLSSRALVS